MISNVLRDLRVIATAAIIAAIPSFASAQLQVKASETVFIKFGVLMQAQGEGAEQIANDDWSQNLFLRRFRILAGGQLAPNLTFFAETDNPNLGRSSGGTKNVSSGFVLQDAFVSWKVAQPVTIDAGLMFVPLCRNCIQSAATLLPIDYGSYTFSTSAATESFIGRDTGVQARGYLAKKRLEYRAGVFQGARDQRSSNSLRAAGRLQYNFLDTEEGFFYGGTNLGKKKIVALGAGFDTQSGYDSFAADFFVDHPVGSGSFTGQLDYIASEGGAGRTVLPEQRAVLAQAGFYFPKARLMPWVKVDRRDFADGGGIDETRYQLGVSHYVQGHNLNVKFGIGRVELRTGQSSTLISLQLQAFYF